MVKIKRREIYSVYSILTAWRTKSYKVMVREQKERQVRLEEEWKLWDFDPYVSLMGLFSFS